MENSIPFAALKDKHWVTLDTETTGLGKSAEVIEISVVDGPSGEVVLDSLVKIVGDVEPAAEKVHGISKEMVADAPTWDRVALALDIVLKDKLVVIYNVPFDVRVMSQSSALAGLDIDNLFGSAGYYCAMSEYARRAKVYQHLQQRLRSFKLSYACELEGVPVPENLHRSAADALLTRNLICKILETL